MAFAVSDIANLVNSGVLGLSALFGGHTVSASVAAGPLAKLEAYLSDPAKNAESIKAQANIIAMAFATTNPAAAGTAAEIEGNPGELAALLPILTMEINQQSSNIFSGLARAVHLSGGTITLQ